MKYKGLIFDIDYFEDKTAQDLASLADYIDNHDVKVGVVTCESKDVWGNWLKNAPVRVDHLVGAGSIPVGRYEYVKKPQVEPVKLSLAWLEREPDEVLSVCTKEIDKEASEKAGIAIIENPAPKDIIPMLTDEPRVEEMPISTKFPAPTTGIFGAVCGDIIGSVYERKSKRTQDPNFDLFPNRSNPTDDSILTMAIAKWLMGDHTDENLTRQLVSFASRHPGRIWGRNFMSWVTGDHSRRVAGSNGSAMRVSPVGYYAQSLDECLALAEQQASLTHNSPEGIAGAQAIAASIFLVRQGKTKAEVKAYIEKRFGYNLDKTLDEIRSTYNLKEISVACNKSAAEAIICWLVADTYEQTVRNAVSLGGDADTIAAMAGGIAAATPGMEIPKEIAKKCFAKLKNQEDLYRTLIEWEQR